MEAFSRDSLFVFMRFKSALVWFLLGRVSVRIEDPLNSLLYHFGLHLLTSICYSKSTVQYSTTSPGLETEICFPSALINIYFSLVPKSVEESTVFCIVPPQYCKCTGTGWMRTFAKRWHFIHSNYVQTRRVKFICLEWLWECVWGIFMILWWKSNPRTYGQTADFQPSAIKMGNFLLLLDASLAACFMVTHIYGIWMHTLSHQALIICWS